MIWVIGKIHSSLASYLSENSIPFGIFADTTLNAKPYHALRVETLRLDSLAGITEQLDQLKLQDVTSVTVSGYDNYVVAASYIAAYYGLPGLSVTAAQAATDKTLMRAAFMAHDPTITPTFASVRRWREVEEFLETTSFPVVLKPAGLMKSLYVTKNSNLAELRANYTKLTSELAGAYGKYNAIGTPGIIIEEFLVGSMHTVGGFVDAARETTLMPMIADCLQASDIGVDDTYLFARSLPSAASNEVAAQIVDVARRGIAALQLTSCPVHVEIMYTSSGPKIIEIGARTGGYRPYMYSESYGIDLYGAQIANAAGKTVGQLRASKELNCCVVELFPKQKGKFKRLSRKASITTLPTLARIHITAKPGEIIGRAQDGYKAAALLVLADASITQIKLDLDYIKSCTVFTTEL